MQLPYSLLCTRYDQVILALGDFMNVQCHACIGGKSIGEDIRRLDYGVQVKERLHHRSRSRLFCGSAIPRRPDQHVYGLTQHLILDDNLAAFVCRFYYCVSRYF